VARGSRTIETLGPFPPSRLDSRAAALGQNGRFRELNLSRTARLPRLFGSTRSSEWEADRENGIVIASVEASRGHLKSSASGYV
jgi:hypothetical protein